MKKFMILLWVLCAPAFAAVETEIVNIGTLATITDTSSNVWIEATLSKSMCGSETFVSAQTTEKDVGFFRMKTLLSQSNATNILAELTIDCDTKTLQQVILR